LQSALAKCAGRWRKIEGAPEPYVKKIMYRIMGCAPGTVASQTSRALARLRVLAPELRDVAPAEEVR
jgi:hypothetical protein